MWRCPSPIFLNGLRFYHSPHHRHNEAVETSAPCEVNSTMVLLAAAIRERRARTAMCSLGVRMAEIGFVRLALLLAVPSNPLKAGWPTQFHEAHCPKRLFPCVAASDSKRRSRHAVFFLTIQIGISGRGRRDASWPPTKVARNRRKRRGK